MLEARKRLTSKYTEHTLLNRAPINQFPSIRNLTNYGVKVRQDYGVYMLMNYVYTTLPVIKQFVPGDIWSLPLSGRQTVLTLSLGVIGFASFNNATSFLAVIQLNSGW